MKELNTNSASKMLPDNAARLIILSLVFLFNPNFNLVDILPDFVAFFILARVFDKASDCAPHFEEARVGFLRLAYLSVAKIPALAIIVIAREGNTSDNDIIALFCLVFAAIELLLLLTTVKHIFDALTYLGERSDARSLIARDAKYSTEGLRIFTVAFSVFKVMLYLIPEFTRLTRSVELPSGIYVKTGSRYYPWMVLGSVIFGFIFGAIWLSRMIKYVKYVRDEGRINGALLALADEGSVNEYEKRREVRSVKRIFLAFSAAALVMINVSFGDLYDVNLLPNFIFTVIFTVALTKMLKRTDASPKLKYATVSVGAVYTAVSAVSYLLAFRFLTEYGYSMLYEKTSPEAVAAYRSYQITAIGELALHIGLSVLFFTVMKAFVISNLGISPKSEAYRPSDAAYHRDLLRKTGVYTAFLALLGILEFATVMSNGSISLIFTNPNDVTQPTMLISSAPWLPTVALIVNAVFVIYSVYYFNLIKEELKY